MKQQALMKLILLTFSLLLLTSCTSSSITNYKEQKAEVTNWHTWNARYVSKTVD